MRQFNVYKMHSWPKFKIVLIKKVGWKSYYCPSFLVMWSKTWMVVVFPIQVFGHVIKNLAGSGFSHPNFLDRSSYYRPTFLTVVFWQVFSCNIAPILNFCQECYYREIQMGVVVFTKVLGHAKSQSLRTLRVLGLSDFTSPWTFAKTTTPIYISR